MRLFNEDWEIPAIIDTHLTEYYDQLSIGILTTKGRFQSADNLYRQLKDNYPDIPIHIIVNYHGGEKLPNWPKDEITIYDDLKGISFCKNQHNFFYPNRPLVCVFDDDAYLTNKYAIDNLLYAMFSFENMVMSRGFCNNCCDLLSKKALARIKWWDERFNFAHDDTDLHMRFERERVKLGLEHNKTRFPDNTIIGHAHHSVNNYSKFNGWEVLFEKWGLKNQPANEQENIECIQLLPDIDLYPEYTEKFLKFDI